MRKPLAAMGATVAVIAVVLLLMAGRADRQQQVDQFADAMSRDAGYGAIDVSDGGGTMRTVGWVALAGGAVMLVGAAASER